MECYFVERQPEPIPIVKPSFGELLSELLRLVYTLLILIVDELPALALWTYQLIETIQPLLILLINSGSDTHWTIYKREAPPDTNRVIVQMVLNLIPTISHAKSR